MPAVLHTPIKVLATTTTTTQPLTNTGTNDFPWSSSADGFLASLFGDERYGWSESTVSCINDGYEPTEARVCSASVAYSPVLDARGQDWHYGYGAWIECTATYDCDETTRISSPGAYGAYPFIDLEHGYYGIIARQGRLGTFGEGLDIFDTIRQ